jgi:SAM-dependent methyltransferase
VETINTCRGCNAAHLQTILSLSEVPVADRLVDEADLCQPPSAFPLTLVFCPNCSLVQIRETLPPEELFGDNYPYHSSFSEQLLTHSRTNAHRLIREEGLTADSRVIELASNDGYMLRCFAERGIPVLGIDPAEAPVRAARQLGIPTEHAFFSHALAECWRSDGRVADVLIANNVLAHVADTRGFVHGIRRILKTDGVASIDFRTCAT